jgi:HEAT repeat protein
MTANAFSRACRLRTARMPLILLPLVLLLFGMLPGCASWVPWTTSDKAARNAELYGPTANQRIKSFQEEAKTAAAAGQSRQTEFTQELARKLLDEHDARVRAEIVAVAGEFGTPEAIAICKGALQDPDERVRTRACEVWRKRGGDEAVQLLANRYRTDRELDVRLRALRMLGELEDKSAVPVLAEALEDPDPAVQYRAVAALKQVSGRDLGDDVNKWREWAADPDAKQPWSIAETFRKLF